MTNDELRKHCERTCNRYRSAYINGNFDKVDKTYEKHKLVLKLLDQEESVLKALEDVRAETERQYKWLFNTKYTRYDVDIAFNSIFRIIDKYRNKAESGDKE